MTNAAEQRPRSKKNITAPSRANHLAVLRTKHLGNPERCHIQTSIRANDNAAGMAMTPTTSSNQERKPSSLASAPTDSKATAIKTTSVIKSLKAPAIFILNIHLALACFSHCASSPAYLCLTSSIAQLQTAIRMAAKAIKTDTVRPTKEAPPAIHNAPFHLAAPAKCQSFASDCNSGICANRSVYLECSSPKTNSPTPNMAAAMAMPGKTDMINTPRNRTRK